LGRFWCACRRFEVQGTDVTMPTRPGVGVAFDHLLFTQICYWGIKRVKPLMRKVFRVHVHNRSCEKRQKWLSGPVHIHASLLDGRADELRGVDQGSEFMGEKELVPLTEARKQVETAITRIALLHLAFSKTLVEEFGMEKGKELIRRSILRYGRLVGERMKRGLPDYPNAKYGAYTEHENGRVYDCVLAKIFREYEELDLGGLYCYVDPAKTMAVDPSRKQVHNDCAACGDEYCTFAELPTTEKERNDFSNARLDWKYVDPRLARGTGDR
jgi:hypothetical protein